jgi:predicted amidohydrolase YtcJ
MTGVERTLRNFSVNGLTTVVDATPSRRTWLFPVYSALRDAGRLPIRVVVMVPADMFEDIELAEFKQDEWLSIGAVKVFHGNSLSGRTAWLSEPYLGRPDDYGIPPARSQAELNALVQAIQSKGMQAAIHSNGDREIDMVLTAFEQLANPEAGDHRHRIEHASVMNRDLLQRARQADVVLALHSYVYEHGDKMEDYGASRWDWMHAHRSALDMGIPVAGNSDFPVSAAIPMLRLQSLVTRRARNGRVYGAKQRIGFMEALRTFTLGAAYSIFAEQRIGSIEAGKLADFVVVDRDPSTTRPSRLSEVGVVSTWVGGQRVSGSL